MRTDQKVTCICCSPAEWQTDRTTSSDWG